jgi:hypothetical protein
VTFGEVVSTATERLGSDGKLVPSSALEVSGMRIGGLPLSFTHDQVHFPGPSYPVPMNDTMKQILQSSGITMQVVTAQVTKNSVVAPALIITAPAAIPGLTDGATQTFIIGGSQASMDGNASAPPPTASGVAGAAPGGATGPAGTGAAGVDSAGLNQAGVDAAGPASSTAGGLTPNQAPAQPTTAALPAQNTVTFTPLSGSGRLVGVFGVDLPYLLLVIGAIAVLGLGQLIQFIGVRRQWKSGVG